MKVSSKLKKTSVLLILAFLFFTESHAQPKIVAYIPNWSGTTFAYSFDYSKVTHICIHSAIPDINGNLSYDTINSVIVKNAHAGNAKVFIVLGDANYENYKANMIDSKRADFIKKIVNYVINYGFDGVDADLEGDRTGGNFSKFVIELADALHVVGKNLSSAVSVAYGAANISNAALAAMDWINVMSYDATGPWAPNSPGQHSSYQKCVNDINYFVERGIPKSKLIVGVPFYGYGFGAAYNTTGYFYKDIVNAYPGSEYADQVGKTIYYNGIPTIIAKTNLGLTCGGVMIWQLEQDLPSTDSLSLLFAINQTIQAKYIVPENLALNKPVEVSSIEADSTAASNAVDNKYATRWTSANTDIEWLYVDLEASYNLQRVKITWNEAYAKDYQIQISDDAVNWTSIKSITENTSLVNDYRDLSGLGRYVRINCTSKISLKGYSIKALEIYEVDAQAPTAPTNLRSTEIKATSINLAWKVSTDNVGISGYDVYQDGTFIGTKTYPPYMVNDLVDSTTYTFTVKAKDEAGNYSSVSNTLTVTTLPIDNSNLALGKTVKVSSTETAGAQLGANAVDGDATTRWSSAYKDPQWIYVDLGANYNVNRVKITWETAYAKAYQIEISTDASSWTNVKSVTGNNTLINDNTGLSGTGRYVRIYGTARATVYGYSIFELEVFGTANTTNIENASENNIVSVYPNPANSILNIELPRGLTSGVVNICSIDGRLLLSKKIEGNKKVIDLNGIQAKGIFTVSVTCELGNFISKVVLK